MFLTTSKFFLVNNLVDILWIKVPTYRPHVRDKSMLDPSYSFPPIPHVRDTDTGSSQMHHVVVPLMIHDVPVQIHRKKSPQGDRTRYDVLFAFP